MNWRVIVFALLLTSFVAGCTEQKVSVEEQTGTPVETQETMTEEYTTEEVQEVTTLENDMDDIDALLTELQELEDINFEI